jgi:hypothetical protein
MVFVWSLPCRIAPRSCSAFGHSPPFSQGAERRAVRGGAHLDPAVPHRTEELQSLRPLAALLAGPAVPHCAEELPGADRRAVRRGVHLDPAVPHCAEEQQRLRMLAGAASERLGHRTISC